MRLKYNDQSHIYTLDGKRCKGVTSVAKIPDDDFNIVRWRSQRMALGVARRPALIEAITAHHTDLDKLDDLIEEAVTAGGGSDAAEWGTAVHRVTERIDGSLELLETPMVKDVRDKWLGLLEVAGLEIVPELRERVVVYPRHYICGKFDVLARVLPGGQIAQVHPDLVGRFVIVDLKTGASSLRYPSSTCIQLALYAHAPLMAGQWPELSGETEMFESMPKVYDPSPDYGYVVYIPPPSAPEEWAEPGVYEMDLAIGWRAVEGICWPALKWRALKAGALRQQMVRWA